MPNKLQQNTLNETIKQYSNLYGLPEHKAFLFFVIEKYLSNLELNDLDIEASIVDGSNDCGIDAIVIDEETDNFPKIYFFQSKFYQKENAFESELEGNALDKLQGAVNDFVLKGKINKSYQNTALYDKLQSIKNINDKGPRYIMVFCSNSKGPSNTAKSKINDFINDNNKESGDEYLKVEYLDLDRIAKELLAPQQKSKVNLKLQTSGTYLTEDTGNVRLFVGTIEAKTLVDLVNQHGDDLFERNVRGYLGSKSLNRNIIKTASDKNSPYFVYMNNGITMTCQKFTYNPIRNSPVLDVVNAQIVNGQQTARALYQANKSEELKGDVKVIIRIVETMEQDLLNQIVEATNSQTRVTSRDLHSNDYTQKLIEQHLLQKGFFYEARKNKYRGKDSSKRVDAETAAQAFYSIFFNEPAFAKDKKKMIFGDSNIYDQIFNDSTKPDDILYSFLLLRMVQKFNHEEKFQKIYSFLNDAALHTISLMDKISGSKVNLDDKKEFENLFKKVTKALDLVVKERREEEGDKYEHRRTFKDPETYGRAVELLEKK